MTSTIINMVERMKDREDQKLESLFASEPIADSGFSDRVVRRIRRGIWIRRLALPTAFVLGGAVAVKPLAGLVASLLNLISLLPANLGVASEFLPADLLPAGPTMLLGVMAVLAVAMIGKMLED